MAYNKYDSDKQVPYMAGIPVKISEQFKPPKKITLPGAIANKLHAETVLPEYDFSLEQSIREKMSQWRELRQSQREARRKRVAAERETLGATEPSEEKPQQLERALSPPTSEPYPILTPVPINASIHSQSSTYSRTFNISEFEQDTASPFDNMELKTINDLEELAHCLQPTTISDKEIVTEEKMTPPRVNGFSTQFVYGSLNWTNSYNQVSGPNPAWYRDQNSTLPQVPANNPPIQSYVVQRLEQGSKSVPDIVQQLERELKGKREAESRRNLEQPQRPASIGHAELSRKANPHLQQTLPPSLLPNPYSRLTLPCQHLADRLAEMGFPLARVARAADRFGDNEARIVEFLVQAQRLEEMNYPADRVEKALIVNTCKETETVQYLNTIGQLLDLGFAEDKVEEALAKCGADRDKALDLLIS